MVLAEADGLYRFTIMMKLRNGVKIIILIKGAQISAPPFTIIHPLPLLFRQWI